MKKKKSSGITIVHIFGHLPSSHNTDILNYFTVDLLLHTMQLNVPVPRPRCEPDLTACMAAHWVYQPRQSDVFWSICRLRSYRARGFPFGIVPHRALNYRF